ncbi:MAG: hypothetical protein JXA42_20640 [Anaerolineales bacterium]|nr:hypothetical protein [Anaerolineales bacterium]
MNDNPKVKLVISFDIQPGLQQVYYQFMISQFVPAIQRMGLQMSDSWHTLYGAYPSRLSSFVGLDLQQMNQVLASQDWLELERRLGEYVTNYSWRIIPLKDGFQL